MSRSQLAASVYCHPDLVADRLRPPRFPKYQEKNTARLLLFVLLNDSRMESETNATTIASSFPAFQEFRELLSWDIVPIMMYALLTRFILAQISGEELLSFKANYGSFDAHLHTIAAQKFPAVQRFFY
jgi:hypothetical protein